MFLSGMQESQDGKVKVSITGKYPPLTISPHNLHPDDPVLFKILIEFLYTNTLDLDSLTLEKAWSLVLEIWE